MKRELDARTTAEGERVCLVWDDEAEKIELRVEDDDGHVLEAVEVPRMRARDAFEHPYVYLTAPSAAIYVEA
jgi:hypothetical protein